MKKLLLTQILGILSFMVVAQSGVYRTQADFEASKLEEVGTFSVAWRDAVTFKKDGETIKVESKDLYAAKDDKGYIYRKGNDGILKMYIRGALCFYLAQDVIVNEKSGIAKIEDNETTVKYVSKTDVGAIEIALKETVQNMLKDDSKAKSKYKGGITVIPAFTKYNKNHPTEGSYVKIDYKD